MLTFLDKIENKINNNAVLYYFTTLHDLIIYFQCFIYLWHPKNELIPNCSSISNLNNVI